MAMSKARDPQEMSRDELLDELAKAEAQVCPGACAVPASRARPGSMADLVLELRFLKATAPSP